MMSYVTVSNTSVLRYMYVMFLFRVTFVHRYRRPNETTLCEHHNWPECNTGKSPYFQCEISPLFVNLEVLLGFQIFYLKVMGFDKCYMFLCIFFTYFIYGRLTSQMFITSYKCKYYCLLNLI